MVAKKPAVTDPFLLALLQANAGVLKSEGVVLGQDSSNEKQPEVSDLLDTNQRVDFRAEAVLISLEYPSIDKIVKECKRPGCGQMFTSNYHAVGYCTRRCLELDLKDRFGIAWTPARDLRKERWEIQAEPKMIPEKALIAMKQLILDVETRLGRSLDTGPRLEFHHIQVLPQEEEQEEILPEPSPILPQSLPSHNTEEKAPKAPSTEEDFDWLFS